MQVERGRVTFIYGKTFLTMVIAPTNKNGMDIVFSKITLKLLFIVGLLDVTMNLVLPKVSLLLWIFFLMIVDLTTGVLKSKILKEVVTSERARGTIIKFLQYFGCIGLTIVLINQTGTNETFKEVMDWAKDGICILIIYIECLSILENLWAMDKKSPISIWIIGPLYMVMSLAVKNNPFRRAAEEAKMEDDEKRQNRVDIDNPRKKSE